MRDGRWVLNPVWGMMESFGSDCLRGQCNEERKMDHDRATTSSSFTRDYLAFMTMLRAFSAGEPLACVECGVVGTRVFYLHTTRGKFLWGAMVCEEHHQQVCQEANARLTHKVRVIHSLREGENN
jgi:hypothetical protein